MPRNVHVPSWYTVLKNTWLEGCRVCHKTQNSTTAHTDDLAAPEWERGLNEWLDILKVFFQDVNIKAIARIAAAADAEKANTSADHHHHLS
jgi:hypothetical protein